MTAPRIFLSHSSKDAVFTARPEADLRAAGATVYRVSAEQGGDFQKRINEALAACEWVVLVLTQGALASPWVEQEIDAANRLKHQGRIKNILPIQAGPVDQRDIPPLWGVYNIFDAARDYPTALAKLLGVIGLSASAPTVASASVLAPLPLALPGEPALHLTPKTLYDLGFQGRVIAGVEVVIPPTCFVPAGPFAMGSDKARDPEAEDDETPQHMIEMGAFAISTFPVTVAEYACFVRSGRAEPKSPWNQLDWKTQLQQLDHPVVNVSWQDAVAYAAWLAKATRQLWRLPTEAEWEKAARGTDGRVYPWGDAFNASRGNTYESGSGATTRVGSYPTGASPCGAQEMAGNVWEWTISLHEPYPYKQNDSRKDPKSFNFRVLRGGSWNNSARDVRAACRSVREPAYLDHNYGFRLVRAAPVSV